MSTITRFALSVLVAVLWAGGAAAQESRAEVACEDGWSGGNRTINVCENREFTLAPTESLQIDAGPNGSVTVTGRDSDEIRVRAQIRSWDRDEDAARDRLEQITIETGRVLRSRGPDIQSSWWPFGRRNGGWNVSFEVMAPEDTGVLIESVNGRITVAGISGELDVETVNGGISLTGVSADARGRTVNGAIRAELAGGAFDGDIVDMRTTNGAVAIGIPEGFSGRIDVETVNGGVNADFPVTRSGSRDREVSATLGSGGPTIRARTVNGGVQLRQR